MKERRYEVVEKIYDFNELSESAKEMARNAYLEEFRDCDFFTEDCLYQLKELFPNSDLKVEYSLSSCQGDGFNIYGDMFLKDAINYVYSKSDRLNKYGRFFEWLKTLDYTLRISENKARYSYCYIDYNDFVYDIMDDLEQDGYTANYEEHEKAVTLFSCVFKNLIGKLCKEFENDGYNYFYEVEDEEIIEVWECNGYEGFYEDGKPCYC